MYSVNYITLLKGKGILLNYGVLTYFTKYEPLCKIEAQDFSVMLYNVFLIHVSLLNDSSGRDNTGSLSHEAREAFLSALVSEGLPLPNRFAYLLKMRMMSYVCNTG